jgi:hypothetical protein
MRMPPSLKRQLADARFDTELGGATKALSDFRLNVRGGSCAHRVRGEAPLAIYVAYVQLLCQGESDRIWWIDGSSLVPPRLGEFECALRLARQNRRLGALRAGLQELAGARSADPFQGLDGADGAAFVGRARFGVLARGQE